MLIKNQLMIGRMPTNYIVFLCILALLICQSSTAQIELKGGIGASFNSGFNTFNSTLKNTGINPVNPASFSGGFGVAWTKNNSRPFLQFNGGAIQNNQQLPSTIIRMNSFNLSLNYAHNLIRNHDQFKVEPHLGIGMNYLELFVWTHDTTTTFTGLLNGDQNLHYERSSLAANINCGLTFSYFPLLLNNRIHLYASTLYQYQLNSLQWKTTDVPIESIHAVCFQIGMGFHLRRI